MKLVVCYSNRDKEYSCDYTLPIEYESPEKFLLDFELLLDIYKRKKREFKNR